MQYAFEKLLTLQYLIEDEAQVVVACRRKKSGNISVTCLKGKKGKLSIRIHIFMQSKQEHMGPLSSFPLEVKCELLPFWSKFFN